jgi:hypothetical protein
MRQEIAYLGHDNSIDIVLKADGVAEPLDSITKMTLTFGTKLISSDNGETDPIRWKKVGYQTGEVRLFLGDQVISPGSYKAPLIIYDSGDAEGIVWDYLNIKVVAEVEAGT